MGIQVLSQLARRPCEPHGPHGPLVEVWRYRRAALAPPGTGLPCPPRAVARLASRSTSSGGCQTAGERISLRNKELFVPRFEFPFLRLSTAGALKAQSQSAEASAMLQVMDTLLADSREVCRCCAHRQWLRGNTSRFCNRWKACSPRRECFVIF